MIYGVLLAAASLPVFAHMSPPGPGPKSYHSFIFSVFPSVVTRPLDFFYMCMTSAIVLWLIRHPRVRTLSISQIYPTYAFLDAPHSSSRRLLFPLFPPVRRTHRRIHL